ncbi:hypothetical protein AAFN60_18605 [Roseibacillus persicicus]|uniref:hypothetical protein n=1 Tax=Roseibacillus persicicus TaxID=454148 RepID=UPI00398B1CDF
MYREVEWKMRVLLSIVDSPGRCVEKQKSDGTLFQCEAIHFDGEGLVQVFRKASDEEENLSVQFSIYGEALAILSLEGEREHLLYERDMGYGSREKANELALKVLKDLEPTITEKEAMAYYL